MTSSDSALAVSTGTSSDTSAHTRLVNPHLKRTVQAIWLVLAILNVVIFAFALRDYAHQLRVGCLCEVLAHLDVQNSEVVLTPTPEGSALRLIQDGDVLLAVNGVLVPAGVTRAQVAALLDAGPIGSEVTLSIRTGNNPLREVTLIRSEGANLVIRMAMRLGLSLDASIGYALALEVFPVLAGIVVASLIAWRRPDDWMALAVAWAVPTFALILGEAVRSLELHDQPVVAIRIFSAAGLFALYTGGLLFPQGRFTPRWTLLAAIAYAIWSVLTVVRAVENPVAVQSIHLGFVGLFVAITTYRYRRLFTPLQRQQTKWVLFGASVVVLWVTSFWLIVSLLYTVALNQMAQIVFVVGYPLSAIIGLSFPLGVAFAILRHRLYDIDFVINRSLVYGAVTAGLGALFLLVFFAAQAVLSAVLGGNGAGAAVAFSAAVTAVLFNPARARMRNLIDRRVYGFRFDLNELNNARRSPNIKNPGALTGYTLGTFQVLGVIGKGGMGEVYQGQGADGTVALKILPDDLAHQDEFLKRFEREARALAAFDHPNIVKLYDAGESEGKYYMALEYIKGQELGDLIKVQGALALKDVRPFVQDFAAALDYAHSKGLVHRDIKPSNIMVRLKSDGETQEAVLMDFGIAKIQDATTNITGTGAIGTIEYMAPEQIMFAKEVDHRADIYALGVVLYEMLTGERPFKGSAGQVLFAHLQQPAPDPRDLNQHIPSKVARAIMKAMAKNPEDRFQSVSEFAAALT